MAVGIMTSLRGLRGDDVILFKEVVPIFGDIGLAA